MEGEDVTEGGEGRGGGGDKEIEGMSEITAVEIPQAAGLGGWSQQTHDRHFHETGWIKQK